MEKENGMLLEEFWNQPINSFQQGENNSQPRAELHPEHKSTWRDFQ